MMIPQFNTIPPTRCHRLCMCVKWFWTIYPKVGHISVFEYQLFWCHFHHILQRYYNLQGSWKNIFISVTLVRNETFKKRSSLFWTTLYIGLCIQTHQLEDFRQVLQITYFVFNLNSKWRKFQTAEEVNAVNV